MIKLRKNKPKENLESDKKINKKYWDDLFLDVLKSKNDKKTQKKSKNVSLFEQKATKKKKKLKNDSFYCVFL